ncbi:polysaccharide biosynthesis family protein, partial [Salmonella enterica subsp. enterica serovar Adelaide]|nr:polysaccharide biosynthesis family protein [Salmonella enterica subsp. enterica serovar Adelaide]
MVLIVKKFLAFGYSKVLPPIIEQFINPICIFVITPLILNHLGKQSYGNWILLITIVSFSQLICGGCSAWIAKVIAEQRATSDYAGKGALRKIAYNLSIIMLSFAILILLILLSLCVFDVARDNTEFLYAIAICGFFQEVDNLFNGALKGFERFNVSCLFEVITRVLWAFIVIYGIQENSVLYYTCLAFILKGTLKYILVCLNISGKFIYPNFDKAGIVNLLNESKWMFLQLTGGISLGLFDRLVIPLILSVNKLSSYVPCLQLVQLMFTISASANQILLPMFARMKASNTFPSNCFFKIQLVSLSSALPCLVLLFFGYDILSIWISPAFASENFKLMQILSISYILLSMMTSFHFLLLGLGKSKLVANLNLIAGLTLAAATLIAAHYGLYAISVVKIIYP